MSINIFHSTQATGTDAGNGEIRKAEWNENHALTGPANQLLGFDGSGVAVAVNPATLGVREFTRRYYADGTWTKPSDPAFTGVWVHVVGPGGGSGGSSTTNDRQGGGGGGGGLAVKWISAASLGSTETINVGLGGSGGASGNNNGSAGSKASTFGSHCSAGAGAGGLHGNATPQPNFAAGGAASGGDHNYTGGVGGTQQTKAANNPANNYAGFGGACGAAPASSDYYFDGSSDDSTFPNGYAMTCPFSPAGGVTPPPGPYNGQREGAAGQFPGGGASGGWRISNSQAGANGADGYVEVVEYYGDTP